MMSEMPRYEQGVASRRFDKYSETSPYGHPVNMVTSLLWPLFLARQNGHTFPYKKTQLMRSPVNMANGHFFKFPTPTILFNLTQLKWPLEKAKTPFTNQTASFLNFHYRTLTATAAVSYLNRKAILKIIEIYDKGVDNKVNYKAERPLDKAFSLLIWLAFFLQFASLSVDLFNFGPSTVLHTKICFTVYWPIFISTLCIAK